MKHLATRAAMAGAVLFTSTASFPITASATVPKACSLLTIAELGKLFPSYTVTPPSAIDPYDCAWAVDGSDSSEYRISIDIRPDVAGRWARETGLSKRPGNAVQHPLDGFGVPAVYDIVDGVYALKSGCILKVSVIGTTGALNAAPKEIETAKAVVAKFSV